MDARLHFSDHGGHALSQRVHETYRKVDEENAYSKGNVVVWVKEAQDAEKSVDAVHQ